MLKLAASEPAWLDILPGVRVQFAPITIKAVRAARRAAAATEDDAEPGDVLARELIRSGILAWEGVGDAEGVPIGATTEAVDLFVRNPVTYEAAAAGYLRDWLAAENEKNAFAGSSSGTGAAATPAKDTASSAAKPLADGARPVRTSSKSRKPKPAS